MELEHYPIIDWELGIKLAGNQRSLAEDMLDLLIKALPNDIAHIRDLADEQNYSELLQQVHKLHGAICYVGLPRLKTLLSLLESNLKNHIMSNLPRLLDQLDTEMNRLLEHRPRQLPVG
jgi:two-component system, NarL family, sensor histidine kinase BarA